MGVRETAPAPPRDRAERMTKSNPRPIILVAPPDGKGWGDLTPEEGKAIARSAAELFMKQIEQHREDSGDQT